MCTRLLNEYDLIVIGGGVIGAFHAWFGCKRGLRTLLIERNQTPRDASVRNFGTLVPSAMTDGDWHRRGVEGVNIYRDVSRETGYPLNTNGTLYLSLTPGERAVLDEFARIGPGHGYACELLETEAALKLNPSLDVENINGALFFPEDMRIESKPFFEFLLPWMSQNLGLTLRMGRVAVSADVVAGECRVRTTSGETFVSSQVVVCSGADFQTLFPHVFARSSLRRCMLHMFKTAPMPMQLPCTVASGLSLRWYSSFQICSSWEKLKDEAIDPEVEREGIHILLVQDADGRVIVGDSHEYSSGDFEERYRSTTEALILREAQKLVRFPHWNIAERWLGIYPLHPERGLFEETVDDKIHIVTGSAGKGMTCGPALGRENIERFFGKA